jgi:hypothetical protein
MTPAQATRRIDRIEALLAMTRALAARAGGGGASPIVPPVAAGLTGAVFQGATATATSNVLSLNVEASLATFPPFVEGMVVQVTGAGPGGADLYTTAAAWLSPTEIELADVASTNNARASVFWYPVGTDDTSNIQAAIDACTENSTTVRLGSGLFVISSTLVASPWMLTLQGAGMNQTAIVASSAAFAGDGLDVNSIAQAVTLQGFTIKGPGLPLTSSAIVTSFTVTSNVATLFTPGGNSYQAGDPVCLGGFQGTGSPLNDVFGTVLASGLSATQFEIELVPGPLEGSTASLTGAATTVTATGLANLTPNLAFLDITISGAEADNNGTFQMTPWLSSTSMQWQNALAPAGPDTNNGAISWIVSFNGTAGNADTGVAHLDYSGIAFTFGQQSTNTLDYACVSQVRSMRWPGDGYKCASPIVTKFDQSIALLNNGNGFAVYYVLQVGSTSTVFLATYANANYQAGYYTHTSAYDAYVGTAADSNGISYYFFTARNAGVSGAGSEATINQNAAYPGWHYYLHGGQGCTLMAAYANADSGVANPSGTYLVMDNQASNHSVYGLYMGGRAGFLPTDSIYIHFSCANNTVWEPYPNNNVLSSSVVDAGTGDTIYYSGEFQTGPLQGFTSANLPAITVSLPVYFGTGPYSSTGLLRLPNLSQAVIAMRSSGGSNITVLGVLASGSVYLGDGVNNNNVSVNVPSGDLFQMQSAGNNAVAWTLRAAGTTLAQVANTVTAFQWSHSALSATGSGAGANGVADLFSGQPGQGTTTASACGNGGNMSYLPGPGGTSTGGGAAGLNGNTSFGKTAASYEGMQGGFFHANADSAPTAGNPTGGGFVYWVAGAMTAKGSSGTVTTIAPAEPHCPACGSDFVQEYSSPKYGYLFACLLCLCKELGPKPWIIREEAGGPHYTRHRGPYPRKLPVPFK